MTAHGFPASWGPAASFTRAAGIAPRIVLYYSGWNEGFRSSFAAAARAHGAVPLVQIEPTGISLRAIAAGRYDVYLRRYAREVRDYAHPVIIGFAHEMNGSWYAWGYRHTSPRTWVVAWRHLVTLFHRAGAKNVVWLWTVSRSFPQRDRSYWPGSKYVTWVGIDGYYSAPRATFRTLFGKSIRNIRHFTSRPILLSETAVGSHALHAAADITSLFAGVKKYHLLGLVYFDINQHGAGAHQDWRLEGHPALLRAFRQGAKSLS